ncbi:hypothetical protein [Streptomyces clavifer]|uniref:hypothetical protein n=1 Tax=Streptomyces clavifer TaxID=68188 RepID=UPI0037F58691
MRLNRAWYAPADAGVYQLTVADHGTSGSCVVRTASQARASHSTARTAPNARPLIEGAR